MEEVADIPEQPCGETITTGGEYRLETDKDLTDKVCLYVIMTAFTKAHGSIKAFCKYICKEECKEHKFVKFSYFASDAGKTKDGKNWAWVELKVDWVCPKKT